MKSFLQFLLIAFLPVCGCIALVLCCVAMVDQQKEINEHRRENRIRELKSAIEFSRMIDQSGRRYRPPTEAGQIEEIKQSKFFEPWTSESGRELDGGKFDDWFKVHVAECETCRLAKEKAYTTVFCQEAFERHVEWSKKRFAQEDFKIKDKY